MQQLSFLPGEMTPGERSLIQRALKALDRHLHEPGVAFTSTHAAREWLILNMAGLEREEFRVLYLNNQNQLIAGETLFTGTINRTEVHPREVIKRALYHNAAAVVLAHNHPSGEVTPSKADRLITIAACLMTYSHHACRTECYAMTVHYYRLRDYALQHPECSAIMRIID
ncbi:JAB domain-containing protein [Escherichia coli]|uniref:JAB domain-containing protein n=12 Tax=Escherichia coli TaxID=562 RepID=UPI000A3D3539|nr:JAB domain-containing protein [Escherichia coli]OUK83518.1 hypothetical protein BZL68_23595 [Escherichia coli]